jgi:hypothetical protein
VQKLALALAAQRSGSARAASSGPTTLPKPRQADKRTDGRRVGTRKRQMVAQVHHNQQERPELTTGRTAPTESSYMQKHTRTHAGTQAGTAPHTRSTRRRTRRGGANRVPVPLRGAEATWGRKLTRTLLTETAPAPGSRATPIPIRCSPATVPPPSPRAPRSRTAAACTHSRTPRWSRARASGGSWCRSAAGAPWLDKQDAFLELVRGSGAREVPAKWHEQLMIVGAEGLAGGSSGRNRKGKGKMRAAADDGVSSSDEEGRGARRVSWRSRSSSSGRVRRASALLDLPAAAAAPADLPVQEAQGKQPARDVAAAEPAARRPLWGARASGARYAQQ